MKRKVTNRKMMLLCSVLVLRLRRKLGWGEGDDTPIETVRGFGYRYRSRIR